jgi:hypothetical protein
MECLYRHTVTVTSDIPYEYPVTLKLCYYLMNFYRLMLVYEHLPTIWKCEAGCCVTCVTESGPLYTATRLRLCCIFSCSQWLCVSVGGLIVCRTIFSLEIRTGGLHKEGTGLPTYLLVLLGVPGVNKNEMPSINKNSTLFTGLMFISQELSNCWWNTQIYITGNNWACRIKDHPHFSPSSHDCVWYCNFLGYNDT